MSTSERRHAFLYRNITAVLMSFAVLQALNAAFQLEISPFFLLLAALAGDVLLAFLDHYKGKAALWLSLAGILAAAFVVLAIFGVSPREAVNAVREWVTGAFTWFREFTAGEDETVLPETGYLLFFACMGVLACSLVIYPLTFHTISRLILSAAALGIIIALPFLGLDLGKLPLTCAGLCVISAAIELVNLQLDRSRARTKPSAGLFLYPVSVLLIFIAIVLPAKETPIRWQLIRDAISKISYGISSMESTFRIWFGNVPEKFSVSFNGLNFNGESGGANAEESSVLIEVSTNGLTRSPSYLRGNVSSTYTGHGWRDESSRWFTSQEPQIELWELMYSMLRSRLAPEPGEDLYKKSMLSITFDNLISKSLLYSAPLGYLDVDRSSPYEASAMNMSFRQMQKVGFSYDVTYFETNWGSETLQNYLRSLDGYRYAEDDTDFDSLHTPGNSPLLVLKNMATEPDPEYYNADLTKRLAERAETIRRVYTQLPEDLPQRVYDLAREITADCENDYDRIHAIQSYFQEGFTYTLTPPRLPEDRDFTDWFLFESSEGYCTYYATAAAVLARCVGLPSRYVEGMLAADRLYSGDVARLTSRNVHAWTEVYLEGYGWIPIDPTPSFGPVRDMTWPLRNNEGRLTELVTHDTINPEDMIPDDIEEQQEAMRPEIDAARLQQLAAERERRQEEMRRLWRIAALSAAGVILLVLLLSWLILRRAKTRRYNRAKDDEKIGLLMREMIRCISVTGKRLQNDETLLEFVNRAGDSFDTHDMTLREAAELYMRQRYGGKHATRMDVLAMYRYVREVRRDTLRHQSLLRRTWYAVWQVVQ